MTALPPKPRRRWFAFSLRTMVVVVALAVVLAAFIVLFPCGPEKMRLANRAQAIHDANAAGVRLSPHEPDAAGWNPDDDLAAIRERFRLRESR